MAIPVSPSVVVIENNNSIYTPNIQSSVVGIVGFADRGPVDKATLITSQTDLINTFGRPSSNIPGQGLEGALEILEATNQIYYVRAASSAISASSLAQLGWCPAVIVSGTTVDTNATSVVYSLVDNNGNTIVSNKTLTLASSTGITSMSAILADRIGSGAKEDSELVAVTYGGVNYLASRYAGANATLFVSSNKNALGFSSLNASGNEYSGGLSLTASGGSLSSTGASGIALHLLTINPGAGYNLSSLRDGTVVGASVTIANKSQDDKYYIYLDGTQRESFLLELDTNSNESIEFNLSNDAINGKSKLVYTQLVSNGSHDTTSLPTMTGAKLASQKAATYTGILTASCTPRFVKPIENSYSLAGGNSGYSTTETGSTDDITALIGNSADKTGLYALDDDSLEISIAIVPGITNQSVQNALITLGETSKNFVSLVAPPYAVGDSQDAVDWMNGRGARTASINNSYAAVYWPWVRTFDFYAGAEEWYDPAIFAARQFVYTDSVAEPWFAPAGYRRGRLTKPTDVEVLLNQGDKDVLYSNNINPITKEVQNGIVIFGQKTGQRQPTALDRVNVRRLLIYMRKVLLQLGKPFQFEPNDTFTWELVEDAIRPFLSDLINRRAIVEGDVKCDATINTPARVDRNELWCSITIKPTKAAETVVFEINLTNQSATING